MTRYLPIAMLALGLVLLSTSFASAQALDRHVPDLAQACALDMDEAVETDIEPPAVSLGRCWKKFGVNMAIPGCTVYAQLPASCSIEPPEALLKWDLALFATSGQGLSPPLALPPPKA